MFDLMYDLNVLFVVLIA